MKTKITELFGITYPIIQGGMAWVAESTLAAAVSNAGGLGLIAGGSAPAELIREEIRKCKALTNRPFGVNIMLMSPNAEELAKIVVEEQVAVVTTGAGNPGKYIESWKAAGIKVVPVVPSVALAKRMERAGADAVVAEGTESGGHIGSTTTFCLTPQVADAVSIPVIAAGGIADGRGIAAAMMLGAEGVQCGTIFLASEECQIHPTYKEMVLGAKDTDSAVTGLICGGAPCRQVKNRYTKKVNEKERAGATFEEIETLTIGSLRRAVQDGDKENGSFMAGQIAGMIHEIRPCKEIITGMFAQAEQLLGNRS
jgi:enoyl-[acyl-carrier protein] reductase II